MADTTGRSTKGLPDSPFHLLEERIQQLEEKQCASDDVQTRLSELERRIAEQDQRLAYQADVISKQTSVLEEQGNEIVQQKKRLEQQEIRIRELEGNFDDQTAEQLASAADVQSDEKKPETISSDHKDIGHSSIKRQMPEEPIGFLATLGPPILDMGVNQNIVFDIVRINKGNGYHKNQGVFIVPKAGLYLIACSLLSEYWKDEDVYTGIVHNGSVVARVYSRGANSVHMYQGSQTVLIEAQKGDEIWVRNYQNTASVHGGHSSSFMGYLLWPY